MLTLGTEHTFVPVPRVQYLVTALSKQSVQRLDEVLVVVDDQNSIASSHAGCS